MPSIAGLQRNADLQAATLIDLPDWSRCRPAQWQASSGTVQVLELQATQQGAQDSLSEEFYPVGALNTKRLEGSREDGPGREGERGPGGYHLPT